MGYPEFILIAIYTCHVARHLLKHGDLMGSVHPLLTLFGNVVTLSLLVWGGFFATFGLAQVFYIFLTVMGQGMVYLKRNDEDYNNRHYNFYTMTIAVTIVMSILAWGGFFS
jgi:hypothetical protein